MTILPSLTPLPPVDQPLPSCAGEIYGSDRYWTCYVRHMSTTFYHLTGGCKMAPASDPYGVVDNKLRYGISIQF